jgi:hypothetical protein
MTDAGWRLIIARRKSGSLDCRSPAISSFQEMLMPQPERSNPRPEFANQLGLPVEPATADPDPAPAHASCGCGCGAPVRSASARFLPGHHMRVANHLRRGHDEICAACGQSFWVYPGRTKRKFRACSHVCYAALRLKLPAWNLLQKRLLRRMGEDKLSFRQMTSAMGVADPALRYWFTTEGSTTPSSTIQAIVDFLAQDDLTYERALQEAGGITAEGRMRESGRAMAAANLPKAGTDAAREQARRAAAAWSAKRDKTRNPDGVKRRLATLEANGTQARFAAGGIAFARSLRGRIVHALFGRLNGNAAPTRDEIQRWAGDVSARLADPEVGPLPPTAIVEIWRPYLEARGVWSNSGRPIEHPEWGPIIAQLVAPHWPGKNPYGFWKAAAHELSRQLGYTVDWDVAKRWWDRHADRYKPAILNARQQSRNPSLRPDSN